jgi:hypothetical protein
VFEKEAHERHAPVENAKEHEDVDPRHVVADDEIARSRIEIAVDPADVPLRRQQHLEDGVVPSDPPFAEPYAEQNHARSQSAARRGHLHGKLDDADEDDSRSPQHRVHPHEEDGQQAAHINVVRALRTPGARIARPRA